jgi:hypothetical protein
MPNDETTENQGSADGAAAAAAAAEPAPEGEVTRLDEPGEAPSPLEGGEAVDPSNTYELGVQPKLTQPGVNYAVPEGATVVSDYQEALDKGYLGYAPGEAAHEAMTASAAGARNERVREAQRATINAATVDNEADAPRSKRSRRK